MTEAEQNKIVLSKKEEQLKEKLDEIDKDKENLRKAENKVELIKLKIKNTKESHKVCKEK